MGWFTKSSRQFSTKKTRPRKAYFSRLEVGADGDSGSYTKDPSLSLDMDFENVTVQLGNLCSTFDFNLGKWKTEVLGSDDGSNNKITKVINELIQQRDKYRKSVEENQLLTVKYEYLLDLLVSKKVELRHKERELKYLTQVQNKRKPIPTP